MVSVSINPRNSGFVQITTLLAPKPRKMSIGSGMFQNLNMIFAREEFECDRYGGIDISVMVDEFHSIIALTDFV